MGYETPRNRAAAGKAAPAGDPAAKSAQESVGRGTSSKCFCEFGVPLVSGLPSQGPARPTTPTHSWTSTQALPIPEAQVGEGASEGTAGCGLSDRSLDLTAGGRGDQGAFRGGLSPLPRLEASIKPGMELSETGAPGTPKGRRINRSLEALPLAPYKKKPKDLGPIWSSWMNLAFCSFPISPAPGPRKGKHPFCTISTSSTGFLRSALWRCLLNEDAWPYISSFAPAILPAWMFEPSSKTCSGIFEGRWSFCGIGE